MSARRGGTPAIVAGSAASGVGSYLFQVVGLRALGAAAYAPISVLWTIQYLVMAVALFPVEAYLTRTISAGHRDLERVRRPLRVLAGWVACTALLLGSGTWLARGALFEGRGQLALVLATVILCAGAFVTVRGVLAGTGRYVAYGGVTATESLVRLAALIPAVLLGAGPVGVAWSLPLGAALAVAWWLARGWRAPALPTLESGIARAEAPPLPAAGEAGSFLVSVTIANAASQLLLAGGPLLLLPLGASPTEVSIYFVTTTAARVPLVFAFGGLLSRLLPPLTRKASEGDQTGLRRLAGRTAAGAVALGLAGASAGLLVGPDVVALFFGAASRPDATFVALTALGVVLATASLLLNQILIARGDERSMVGPWLAALAAAAPVIALASGTPTIRVSIGFVAAEVVAMAGLLLAIMATRSGAGPRI